ncbi:tetratricopeptide repeat protein [Azospirillum sp. RWY-5-1]|uniref:Tetratricopeptide repeat protein n=1 Tax=Azospirillum oleiclasticum TaxID=2735135 RepID=A0ABX2T4J7_9PROT|nr:tetratricopeptide repeat protein [Azospirillum oleiclasticum]NYZ11936.1 tetratricopeptide repeat protein [Azospirillum oleiclasticum]NYZ19096.1 tetratricopeptide repeat protein [Azospirillum oleiclasticum]
MSDIFREVDEDLRRDRVQSLAKRYGGVAVAVAFVVVAGTAGYTGWKHWRQSQREDATQRLTLAMEQAVQAPAQGVTALTSFTEAAAPADLATLARLNAAALQVQQGKPAEAAALYDSVANDASARTVYRELATLMSVMQQLGTGDPGQLQARLQPLTADTNPWRHSAREMTALLAARAGDREKARTLFTQLADDPTAPAGVRTRAGELAALYAKT